MAENISGQIRLRFFILIHKPRCTWELSLTLAFTHLQYWIAEFKGIKWLMFFIFFLKILLALKYTDVWRPQTLKMTAIFLNEYIVFLHTSQSYHCHFFESSKIPQFFFGLSSIWWLELNYAEVVHNNMIFTLCLTAKFMVQPSSCLWREIVWLL